MSNSSVVGAYLGIGNHVCPNKIVHLGWTVYRINAVQSLPLGEEGNISLTGVTYSQVLLRTVDI